MKPSAWPPSGPFQLADGREVWLRRLRADDAPRLGQLYQRLSAETVRRRFLRERTACDPREAYALASVDQVRRVAIAAFRCNHAGSPVVAVGRFHGDGSKRAELALLVEDAYQRVGLGRLLLEHLLEEARRQHLERFDGYVLYENRAVLRLLRSSGHTLEVHHYGGGVLAMQLTIAPPAPEPVI